jgi:alpha-N-acetylglucosamine transferase
MVNKTLKLYVLVFIVLIFIFYKINRPAKEKAEEAKKFAYVVLNTNMKSLFFSLVLFHQLRMKNCKMGEFIIMIPSEIDPKISELLKILKIKKVIYEGQEPLIKPKYLVTNEATRDRDKIMWEKLRVWNMTEYEKIILLDNDLLIRENIDNLFEKNSISAVPALFDDEKIIFWDSSDLINFKKVNRVKKGDGLNGGLIVLKPDKKIFEDLIMTSESLTNRTCCPFQEFIFRYFENRGEYQRLSDNYNMRKLARQKNVKINEIKVYHFVERKKPWILGKNRSHKDPMAKEWWKAAENFTKFMHKICTYTKIISICEVLENVKKESIQFAMKINEEIV